MPADRPVCAKYQARAAHRQSPADEIEGPKHSSGVRPPAEGSNPIAEVVLASWRIGPEEGALELVAHLLAVPPIKRSIELGYLKHLCLPRKGSVPIGSCSGLKMTREGRLAVVAKL